MADRRAPEMTSGSSVRPAVYLIEYESVLTDSRSPAKVFWIICQLKTFSWGCWGVKLGPCTCKVGASPLSYETFSSCGPALFPQTNGQFRLALCVLSGNSSPEPHAKVVHTSFQEAF